MHRKRCYNGHEVMTVTDYGKRLRQAREDADMTQEEMAAFLGTVRQQIGRYETGHQELTATRLAAICRRLGVSADYILGLPKGLPWPR